MISVDYTYYTDTYKGTYLSNDLFNKYVVKANMFVNTLTCNRASSVTESSDGVLVTKLKMCICEMCDRIGSHTSDGLMNDSSKSSETVGPWSVSYKSDSVSNSIMKELKSVVDMYLSGTYLTYMWC